MIQPRKRERRRVSWTDQEVYEARLKAGLDVDAKFLPSESIESTTDNVATGNESMNDNYNKQGDKNIEVNNVSGNQEEPQTATKPQRSKRRVSWTDQEQFEDAVKRGKDGDLKFIPGTTINSVPAQIVEAVPQRAKTHPFTKTVDSGKRSPEHKEAMSDNFDKQEDDQEENQNSPPRIKIPTPIISALEDWFGTMAQQVAQEAANKAVRRFITDTGRPQPRQEPIPIPKPEPEPKPLPKSKARAKAPRKELLGPPPPPVCEICWSTLSQQDHKDPPVKCTKEGCQKWYHYKCTPLPNFHKIGMEKRAAAAYICTETDKGCSALPIANANAKPTKSPHAKSWSRNCEGCCTPPSDKEGYDEAPEYKNKINHPIH